MSIFAFEVDIPGCLSAQQVLDIYQQHKSLDEAIECVRELVKPYLEEQYENLFYEIQNGLEDETSELLWNFGIEAELEQYDEEEENT